jgi:GTPase Era involved in 16S rRNA processing
VLEKLIDAQRELCDVLEKVAELQKRRGHDSLSRSTQSSVESIREFRFRIGILGSMKRGKSTLINALLDRPDDALAPVSVVPATGVITEFDGGGAGASLTARVFHGHGSEPTCIEPSEIRDFATESGNPGNQKGVERIRVTGDFPLLGTSATLVDTPGNGSIYELHSESAHDALNVCDVYVLLVSATIPIDRVEQEFLQSIGAQQKRQFIIALTKCDELAPADKPAVIARIREECRKVGLQPRTIIELSAKKALDSARSANAATLRKESGIQGLIQEMERIISSHSIRMSSQKARMVEIASQASNYLSREEEACKRSLEMARLGKDEIERQRADLLEQFEKAKQVLGECQGQFKRKWRGISKRFASAVRSSGAAVEATLQEWLDRQRGPFGMAKASTSLKVQAVRSLATQIQPKFAECQIELEDAVEKLRMEADDAMDIAVPRLSRGAEPMDSVLDAAVPTVTTTAAGVAVVAVLSEAVAVRSAFGAMTDAETAYEVAVEKGEVAGAVSQEGLWSNLWGWVWGSGDAASAKIDASQELIERKEQVMLATSGLWGTMITGIVVSGGSIITALVASKIAEAVVRGKLQTKIGDLVERNCDGVVKEMLGDDGDSGKLGELRDLILERLQERLEDLHKDHLKRLDKLESEVKSQSPHLAQRLETDLAEICQLLQVGDDIRKRIRWQGA